MTDEDLLAINELVKLHCLKAELLSGIYRVCVLGDARGYLPVIVLVGPFPGHETLAALSTAITNRYRVGSVTFQLAVAEEKSDP